MSTFASRVIERMSHTSERSSQLAILEAESADALDSLGDVLAQSKRKWSLPREKKSE
jgi:hypothetical protein